jgi:hypothetical protein
MNLSKSSKKIKTITILALMLVCFAMGCVTSDHAKADSGRFTVLYSNEFGSDSYYIRVVHDNQYNTTLYATSDSLAIITDEELQHNLNFTSHKGD